MDSNLRRWSSRPVWLLNAVAASTTAFLMIWMFVLGRRAADPESAVRSIAIFFTAVHGVLHVLSHKGLQLLVQHHRDGAREALRAYLDVRRVSHLDQAMAWVGYFAAAPHLV
jgi:hypothetical protein